MLLCRKSAWEDEKVEMGEVISLISAKGGMGKTSIAVNIAHAATEIGLKVLLIDCDLHTMGATYFYEIRGESIKHSRNVLQLQRLLNEIMYPDTYKHEEKASIYKTKDNVYFIPAGNIPILEKDSQFTNEQIGSVKMKLTNLMDQWVNEYDVVLLDHAAGYGIIADLFLSVSTKIVLITEGGMFALEATRDFFNSIKTENKLVICCCNKLDREHPVPERPDSLVRECNGFCETDVFKDRMRSGEFIKNISNEKDYSDGKILGKMMLVILDEFSNDIQDYIESQRAMRKSKQESQNLLNKEVLRNYAKLCLVGALMAIACGLFWGIGERVWMHSQLHICVFMGIGVTVMIGALSQYKMIIDKKYRKKVVGAMKSLKNGA